MCRGHGNPGRFHWRFGEVAWRSRRRQWHARRRRISLAWSEASAAVVLAWRGVAGFIGGEGMSEAFKNDGGRRHQDGTFHVAYRETATTFKEHGGGVQGDGMFREASRAW